MASANNTEIRDQMRFFFVTENDDWLLTRKNLNNIFILDLNMHSPRSIISSRAGPSVMKGKYENATNDDKFREKLNRFYTISIIFR